MADRDIFKIDHIKKQNKKISGLAEKNEQKKFGTSLPKSNVTKKLTEGAGQDFLVQKINY